MNSKEEKLIYYYIEKNVLTREDTEEPIDEQQVRLVFPSAQLLLDCAKDEYTKERERQQFLDSKSSFFMSAIILVATIFIPFIPFGKMRGSITAGTEIEKAITCVFGAFMFVSFVILIVAFAKLYNAYKIQEYARFNIENLSDMGNLTTELNLMEKALCVNYQEVIKKNIEKNDNKAVMVSGGIGLCSIGFFMLTFSAIILKIYMG